MMSDSDTSASQSIASNSSDSLPYQGLQGLIYVNCNIRDPRITEALLEEWNIEHFNDLLGCPDNVNLCLRHHNINTSYTPYDNLTLFDRLTKSPEETRKEIEEFNWHNLTLVKVNDLGWMHSAQFKNLPLTSKLLPPKEDGSWGNAVEMFNPALRTYEKVSKTVSKAAAEFRRARFVVTVQVDSLDEEGTGVVEKAYAGYRSVSRWRLAPGLIMYQEPGDVPEGLMMFDFDEEPRIASEEDLKGVKVVKQDVWKNFVEMGDKTLEL